ncbi:SpoIIE family protein phosphatase [Paenibacillus hodogayensis]|uniref:SpoIIE family protein phosphatase n=1 Tax=Paenibacillus hodogayensis TaxID=279208 RepID=A0ABV5VUZ3_9BACL
MKETGPSSRSAFRHHPLYDSSVAKVSAFAAVLLVVSIILIGAISYAITRGQSVKKLKENDLVYIGSSISAKISGTIERALETSRLMANDHEVKQWIVGGEKQDGSERAVMDKLSALNKELQYDNSFIVTAPAGHYYAENGKLIDIMSPEDPDDKWYYDYLKTGKTLDLSIDYNAERQDTSVFVNALMQAEGKPIAIVGVGFSLRDMSAKFADYKYGEYGSLWLTDSTGRIYLSEELDQNGKNIADFLPSDTAREVIAKLDQEQSVLDYKGENGRMNDLILLPVPSTGWTLVVSVDRNEAISYLKTIQGQTAAAVGIAVFSVLFFFSYTSRRLADPYKRAVTLNVELERQIALRTKELAEQNEKMLDSIDYASRIQQAVLPSAAELAAALPDHFVLWKPRDVVGGDFYWVRQVREGVLVAVGDCTGHGVPGAFMSIMTVSMLDQIVKGGGTCEPADVLSQLNRSIKRTLNQIGKEGLTDDGLDIGLCLLTERGVTYAGAGCSLYIRKAEGLVEIEGNRKSPGYRKTPDDYAFIAAHVETAPDDRLYIATDGLTDQNGGEKDYSFGKTRLKRWLEANAHLPPERQKLLLEEVLAEYRGAEPQRDDITVFGFRSPYRTDSP